MSPDRVPSVFSERPIRPLPKRKLREKLSPEAIRTIQYPPATVHNIPLFYYPTCNTGEPPRGFSKASGNHQNLASATPENVELSQPHGSAPPAVASSAQRGLQGALQELVKHHAPTDQGASPDQNVSAASSIDGYDSLENANNKKKRKIPSASDSTLRGPLFVNSGSIEMLELGSRIDDDIRATAPALAVSGSSSTHNDGISGSGRGRIGRAVHARSPLRTISDGNNTWPSRPLKAGLYQMGTSTQFNFQSDLAFGCQTDHLHADYEATGIITNAIANAERLAPSGQENAGSLLRQHSDFEKTTPVVSQFTFTCGLQVTGTAPWPGNGSAHCPLPQTKGTLADVSSGEKATKAGRRRTRINSRRQLEKDIFLAARDRRRAAMDAYHHSPPRLEDVWICEFCEYERIFGSPPKALIREYEMKDRRYRQEEADRRRLLEKAKAKSRKGRKGNKATKGSQSTTQSSDQIPEEHAAADAPAMEPNNSHSTQWELDYEDRVDGYRSRDPPDILGLYEKRPVPEKALLM
ncbi:hypothetical protein IF1G_07946 [Cordyceps javanica]|uniref:Uncharacterized protein n=1 Tax=Cordyceps javanica TaxID=43265 RepID=A0A545VUB9_9HYPO|nr:hypothetical protein IF1G_07946 [Cordyceps javanica]TQW05284.1 hypothetical protein IF2G_07221 [Cordyceps javanica]